MKQRYNSVIPKTITLYSALCSYQQNAAAMFTSYIKSVYSCEVINDDVSNLKISFFNLPNIVYFTVDDVF